MERRIASRIVLGGLLLLAAGAGPPAGAADAARQRARTCAELAAQYQRLEARMRSGYSARESERLWEQHRRLQARRWALRCRGG